MYDRLGEIYAQAAMDGIGDGASQEELYEDMLALMEIFSESYDFRDFLYKTNLKGDQVVEVISSGFGFKESTKKVLKFLVFKGRLSSLRKIAESYVSLYEKKNGVKRVTATTAFPLDEKQEDEILESLKQYLKSNKILLSKEVDPHLIGGVKLFIDGQVYDNSLRAYLSKLRLAIGKGEPV